MTGIAARTSQSGWMNSAVCGPCVAQELGAVFEATDEESAAFMRTKLGSGLESRGVAPHIYESEAEAEAAGAVGTILPRQE